MAWTRGPFDPTYLFAPEPEPHGLLAYDPTSTGAAMMAPPWLAFARPLGPGWSLSPRLPLPTPSPNSDFDDATPWPSALLWPSLPSAPGGWPLPGPDIDPGSYQPVLPWPTSKPYPPGGPQGDAVMPSRPLLEDLRRDRSVPMPLAHGSAAEGLVSTHSLLDPSHWADADGERHTKSVAINQKEGAAEILARRVGLEPEDVALIDSAPASLLANVLVYRDLDDNARQDVDERLRALVERNRGRGGDPHAFGIGLHLQEAIKNMNSPAGESSLERTEKGEPSAEASDPKPQSPSPDELMNMPYEFYPSPPAATDDQVRVLEELLRRPDIDEETKGRIRDYLDDRTRGRDRLLGPDEWMDERGRIHRPLWPQPGYP